MASSKKVNRFNSPTQLQVCPLTRWLKRYVECKVNKGVKMNEFAPDFGEDWVRRPLEQPAIPHESISIYCGGFMANISELFVGRNRTGGC